MGKLIRQTSKVMLLYLYTKFKVLKKGGLNVSVSRILKWVTGGFEAFLGIPVIGGAFIIGLLWIPLAVMLVLHIITLVLTRKDGGPATGSILGIVASALGWIPGVGMVLHILAAIFLMINAATPDNQDESTVETTA